MDFDLTDEQRLLKDSVDRLIADQYQFEQRKKFLAEPDGWSRSVWQQFAELGLLGLPFAEQFERAVPKLEVQDFTFTRQQVVLHVESRHGREMIPDDGR